MSLGPGTRVILEYCCTEISNDFIAISWFQLHRTDSSNTTHRARLTTLLPAHPVYLPFLASAYPTPHNYDRNTRRAAATGASSRESKQGQREFYPSGARDNHRPCASNGHVGLVCGGCQRSRGWSVRRGHPRYSLSVGIGRVLTWQRVYCLVK